MAIRHLTAVAALAVLGSASFPPPAQDPKRPKSPPNLVLEAGEHDLPELIARTGRFLKHNYILTDLAGKKMPDATITLQHPLALSPQECPEVVAQLALSRDMVRIPLNVDKGIYQWISLHGPHRKKLRSHPLRLSPAQVRAKRNDVLFVLTSVPVEHVQAQSAANTLRPFFGQDSQAQGYINGTGQSIVAMGFVQEVAGLLDLIEEVDQPAKDPAREWKQQLVEIHKRLSALEKAGG